MTSSNTADRYGEVHACMMRGDRPGAESLITDLLEANPEDAEGHFLLGRIALEAGALSRAKAAFERAVALDPEHPHHQAFFGFCCAQLGEWAKAARAAEAAAALAPSDYILDLVAQIWSRIGLHRNAVEVLQRAVAEGSRNPQVYFDLGVALKYCGDLEGSRRAAEQAIALDTNNFRARVSLSALRTATFDDNQVEELDGLLGRVKDPGERLQIAHALASELHALGEYDRAFETLEAGKSEVRARIPYDFRDDQALFDAMHSAFEHDRPVRGFDDADPIFVVGMPRSGTTVVDRMLSLDPKVRSVGETMHIAALLQELAGRASTYEMQAQHSACLLDPRDVPDLASRADLSDIGRSYMSRVPPGGPQRIVDKFPLNSLLAGFILTALPNARVICVVRGAMDTIVGNYRQLLAFESPVFRYTLSLETCARYYVEFRRLTEFWSSRFSDRFLSISYEQLVADPDKVSRKMFDFCGLSWHPGVTKIEANQASVTTASAVQVREPLNARSIGRWRAYERFLEPALSILAEARIEP